MEYVFCCPLPHTPTPENYQTNPIAAGVKCKYTERDIRGYLDRYAKDGDITDVWIWYEQTGSGSYEIYIGYA